MIGRPIWSFGTVDSTQRIAMRLAELGAPHGTVVRAEFQTAGRGRQGRRWDSPPGTSLMFSVLLRPDRPLHELGTFSLRAGASIADMLRDEYQLNAELKWPNDVLIDGRKVSGILIQTRSGAAPIAVIGIGVNVSTPQDDLPDDACSVATAVGAPVNREQLFEHIIHHIGQTWESHEARLSSSQRQQLESLLWLRGRNVTLQDGDRVITGSILGLGPGGELRLQTISGDVLVASGELTRGPRPN